MTVPSLTVLASPQCFHAGQDEAGIPDPQIHRHRPAARRSDDDFGPMPVKHFLPNPNRSAKILIRQRRIEHRMPVPLQICRLDAAGDGLPAVEKEDSHGDCDSSGAAYMKLTQIDKAFGVSRKRPSSEE
jgi:hypothetical protein